MCRELVPKDGIEPPTRAPSTRRSTPELLRRNGAGGGNRNRVFGVALRGLTFQLRPHGGKRKESNLLPQRDCVYGAATAPAVLIGASRNCRRAEGSNLGPRGPLGFRDRLPATPAALSWNDCCIRRRQGYGGQPSRTTLGLPAEAPWREGWCISQDSNLDPVPYEGTALPIELEMRNVSATGFEPAFSRSRSGRFCRTKLRACCQRNGAP